VKIVTLAPEIEGASEFIKHVISTGVVVSLGHSNADEEDVVRAVDAGATMSTHLGNGISSLLARHPNAIWAQLADDRLTASFIADRHHLPRSTLTAMIRAKGVERALLISDSVRFAGQPAGRYRSAIGGDVEVSQDGRVSIAGTPFLAGSGSCLLDILLGFPEFTSMPLEDAVTMACSTPARHIGLENELAEGQPANFILLEQDGKASKPTVRDIIFDGESVM
jgi:N-acetylglucosamine-6-phosphate deacetylase